VTSCPGASGGGDAGGGGGSGSDGDGQETLTYATATEYAVEEAEVEVDEVKMEAEDHLAREYVQEFVLDHLDPADVKREVRRRPIVDFFLGLATLVCPSSGLSRLSFDIDARARYVSDKFYC